MKTETKKERNRTHVPDKTEIFLAIDSDLVTKLRLERVETGVPVNQIVSSILSRHYRSDRLKTDAMPSR